MQFGGTWYLPPFFSFGIELVQNRTKTSLVGRLTPNFKIKLRFFDVLVLMYLVSG